MPKMYTQKKHTKCITPFIIFQFYVQINTKWTNVCDHAIVCVGERQSERDQERETVSVRHVHHQRSDKLRVPYSQGEGGRPGEVCQNLLWAVGAGAGDGRGIAGPGGPALHGEGGLALEVDAGVGAVVVARSGGHGQVLRGGSDMPAAGHAVAGTGSLVGHLGAQQVRQRVPGRTENMLHLLASCSYAWSI